MGTYPSFAFTPSDDAVIIWAAGSIYFVPLAVNEKGEKVAGEDEPFPIKFSAHVAKRLAETRRSTMNLVGLETRDTQRVYAFKELRVDDSGRKAVFQAAGATYAHDLETGSTTSIPVAHQDLPYYSPSFAPGTSDLILHCRWSDQTFTTFELANLSSGLVHEITGIPMGRYHSPVLCECPGRERQIAFIKTHGDALTGNVVATADPGLYLGDITLPAFGSTSFPKIAIRNLRFIPSEIDVGEPAQLRFLNGKSKLLVQQSNSAFVIDIDAGPDDRGEFAHRELASGRMSMELSLSPRLHKNGDITAENVAFVDFFHVYFVPGAKAGKQPLWSKPYKATEGLVRLSLDGGHDITWSRDGKKLYWFLGRDFLAFCACVCNILTPCHGIGPYLHSLEVSRLSECGKIVEADPLTFGISCVKDLVRYQEVVVLHSTDIGRLKRDARASSQHETDSVNSDVLVIANATILSMETGDPDSDLIHDGILVTRGGVIESVGTMRSVVVPAGATVIDAHGGMRGYFL